MPRHLSGGESAGIEQRAELTNVVPNVVIEANRIPDIAITSDPRPQTDVEGLCAADQGHIQLMQLLLDNGAVVDLNKAGHSSDLHL